MVGGIYLPPKPGAHFYRYRGCINYIAISDCCVWAAGCLFIEAVSWHLSAASSSAGAKQEWRLTGGASPTLRSNPARGEDVNKMDKKYSCGFGQSVMWW